MALLWGSRCSNWHSIQMKTKRRRVELEEWMKEIESLDQGLKKKQNYQGLVQQWNESHVSENKSCSHTEHTVTRKIRNKPNLPFWKRKCLDVSAHSQPLLRTWLTMHRVVTKGSILNALFFPRKPCISTTFQYLKRSYNKEGDRTFCRVCCDRARGNAV